jgi:hypothetical protein
MVSARGRRTVVGASTGSWGTESKGLLKKDMVVGFWGMFVKAFAILAFLISS